MMHRFSSFVSTLLTKNGFNVLGATTGEDALKQSREYSGPIHLLLSDIEMPRMSGIELGAKFVLERPDTKVLLMSGFAAGMLVLIDEWHFLNKPFVPSELTNLIVNLLD